MSRCPVHRLTVSCRRRCPSSDGVQSWPIHTLLCVRDGCCRRIAFSHFTSGRIGSENKKSASSTEANSMGSPPTTGLVLLAFASVLRSRGGLYLDRPDNGATHQDRKPE